MNLEADLKTEEACADHLQARLLQTRNRINNLKEKIAIAEKRKLRHGDYGTVKVKRGDKDINSFVVVGNEIHYNTGTYNNISLYYDSLHYEHTKTGNTFDDLKALQEDLPTFEVDGVIVAWEHDCIIMYEAGHIGHRIMVGADAIDKFAMGVRQMRETQKRNG